MLKANKMNTITNSIIPVLRYISCYRSCLPIITLLQREISRDEIKYYDKTRYNTLATRLNLTQ